MRRVSGGRTRTYDLEIMSLTRLPSSLPRQKESIQPQVPLRLPCYDFTPVTRQVIVTLLKAETFSTGCFLQLVFYNVKNIKNTKKKSFFFLEKKKNRRGKLSSSTHFRLIQLPECDGRRVQGSGTDSPWRADPRLLVIPT